jgi:hypothetical protein
MSSSKELQFVENIEDEEVKDFLKNFLKENSLKIVKKKQKVSKCSLSEHERCCATTKNGEQCKRKKGKSVPTKLCLFHYNRPSSHSIDMDIDPEEDSPEEIKIKIESGVKQENFYDSLCKKINSLEI